MICGPSLKRTKLIIGHTTMTVTIELVFLFFYCKSSLSSVAGAVPYVFDCGLLRAVSLKQCDFGRLDPDPEAEFLDVIGTKVWPKMLDGDSDGSDTVLYRVQLHAYIHRLTLGKWH